MYCIVCVISHEICVIQYKWTPQRTEPPPIPPGAPPADTEAFLATQRAYMEQLSKCIPDDENDL